MKIIDGQLLADTLKNELAQRVRANSDRPGLAILLVGDNEGSRVYVNLKKRAAEYIGIDFHLYKFPEDATYADIEQTIDWLNTDDQIDGILIQLPLPKQLDENALIARIVHTKDADGFHPANIKKFLSHDQNASAPALVQGILALIISETSDLQGMTAALCTNSSIFALPLAEALEQQGARVTSFVQATQEDIKKLSSFDIVVVAVGKKYFLSSSNIKNDAIVIDVGYNRDAEGVSGDVNTDSFHDTHVAITPVPGGVGPMTVAYLLKRVTDMHEENKQSL